VDKLGTAQNALRDIVLPVLNVDEAGKHVVTINLAWQMKRDVGREGVRGSRTPG
jgi:hypothetical protein